MRPYKTSTAVSRPSSRSSPERWNDTASAGGQLLFRIVVSFAELNRERNIRALAVAKALLAQKSMWEKAAAAVRVNGRTLSSAHALPTEPKAGERRRSGLLSPTCRSGMIPGQQAWNTHDDAGVLISKLEQQRIGRGAVLSCLA